MVDNNSDNTPFLSDDDYASVCDTYEMDNLKANPPLRLQAEQAAMEQVASYLRHRYDMQAAYAQRGTGRNPMLVQCTVAVTLWLMVHRLPQGMGHERRECLYQDAIKWLRDVQASKASPQLPTYTSADGQTDLHNPIRHGSMPPQRYDW